MTSGPEASTRSGSRRRREEPAASCSKLASNCCSGSVTPGVPGGAGIGSVISACVLCTQSRTKSEARFVMESDRLDFDVRPGGEKSRSISVVEPSGCAIACNVTAPTNSFSPTVAGFFGLAYLALYFAFTLLVPILLIAAGLVALWNRNDPRK